MKQLIAFFLLLMCLRASASPSLAAPPQNTVFRYQSDFAVVYSRNSNAPVWKWKIVLRAQIDQDFTLDPKNLSVYYDKELHEKMAVNKMLIDPPTQVTFLTVSELGITESWHYNRVLNRLSRTFLADGYKYFTIVYYNKKPSNKNKEDYIK